MFLTYENCHAMSARTFHVDILHGRVSLLDGSLVIFD